jgi:hypothetical protein
MGDTVPGLASITPALDLILSYLPDPAHSEYQSMSELMYDLLLDSILTEAGKKSYSSTLRNWPFPSGWELYNHLYIIFKVILWRCMPDGQLLYLFFFDLGFGLILYTLDL